MKWSKSKINDGKFDAHFTDGNLYIFTLQF